MLQLFNKWVLGFATSKKTVGGRTYRFKFRDKPVFFDAIGMLGEFKQRVNEQDIQQLELTAELTEVQSSILHPIQDLKPTTISSYSKKGQELVVSRFVLKEGLHSQTVYAFESNREFFGAFQRTYDYGSAFSKFGMKLAELNQSDLLADSDKWVWKSPGKAILFLEKFGHTQCWFFSKVSLLDFWRQD